MKSEIQKQLESLEDKNQANLWNNLNSKFLASSSKETASDNAKSLYLVQLKQQDNQSQRATHQQAIYQFIINDNDEEIAKLLQQADKLEDFLKAKDHLGHSPLYVTKLYCKKNIERLLVEKGATMNDLDMKNLTLANAIIANDYESFEIVLQTTTLDEIFDDKPLVNLKNIESVDQN